jgi:hypothetical protein
MTLAISIKKSTPIFRKRLNAIKDFAGCGGADVLKTGNKYQMIFAPGRSGRLKSSFGEKEKTPEHFCPRVR